jgi:uncharacterized cupin superfamily protein
MEVEPMGDESSMEIRFSRKFLDSNDLGVTLERFAPGHTSTDGHSHKVQEEAYVVIEGSGVVKLDDERIEVKQWDVIRVAPATVRWIDAGPDGLEIIAVGSDRPEGGDGVPAERTE